eukprot:Em0008g553a
MQQSAERAKSVEQLEAKIAASTRAVKKGFLFNEGPFVKELDKALQGFGVHHQQYFGGAFVGQCIKEFLSYFRTAFPGATIPIKMHMLEDHATEWVRLTHVGFGLLGEQGAESIHAKFNSLGRAYTAIPDRVEWLKCIMKEHLANSMDPEKAIEFARSKRPHISINERQRQRILEFHDSLKAEKQE